MRWPHNGSDAAGPSPGLEHPSWKNPRNRRTLTATRRSPHGACRCEDRRSCLPADDPADPGRLWRRIRWRRRAAAHAPDDADTLSDQCHRHCIAVDLDQSICGWDGRSDACARNQRCGGNPASAQPAGRTSRPDRDRDLLWRRRCDNTIRRTFDHQERDEPARRHCHRDRQTHES